MNKSAPRPLAPPPGAPEGEARGVPGARPDPVAASVSPAAFDAWLTARFGDRANLAGRRLDDLRLAFACARGDRAALATLDRDVLAPALKAVARIDPAPHFLDEVTQAVRVRLLVGEGALPRIESYEGKAPRVSWVKAVALRVALSLIEGRGPKRRAFDERWLSTAVAGEAESSILKDAIGRHFRVAFAEAIDSLPVRDRTLLRMHLVEGVTLDEVALAFRVHRATVARWLALARGLLLNRTRDSLVGTLGIKDEEVESLLAFARSRLEVSLSGFLTGP